MIKVSDLPDDNWLMVAHKKSIYHRKEIEESFLCGCFHCRHIFQPKKIREWVDVSGPLEKQTALCPHCAIDSVIGDASGFDITEEFLREMKRHWF